MCDETVDDCLTALKFIPDWFVTSKMIKNFLLLCTQMTTYSFFLSINLSNIYLDNNFDENDPDTIILVRLLTWHSKFKKGKTLKKKISKEFM